MTLKEILPYEYYTLSTKLSEEEVYRRMINNIEPEKVIRFSLFKPGNLKPYEGVIHNNTFLINRIIYYRNSWLPIIEGTINSFMGQTEIIIKMRLSTLTKIILSIFLSINIFFCFSVLMGHISDFSFSLETKVMPFIILGILCLVSIVAFKIEANIAKKFLAKILEAEK